VLSSEELERYQRQIIIPGFGEGGQEKLKHAKVLLVGAGGLGSPGAIYLVAAGVGTLRIVDSDTVSLGNLNRQILHWTKDIGRNKIESAAEKLKEINPEIKVETIKERLTEDNGREIAAGYDLIVDAVDNLPTRYLLNRTAMDLKLPLFHGAVYGFQGQAMTILPGQTPCLMCLYRGASPRGTVPVVGATPAVIASIQATEVIKYITGLGQLLTNRLLIYDGLNLKFQELKISRDPGCSHCGGNQ
jgi:molybdopterin/thiamine biosynthesis adenylyltransferase